MPDGNKGTDWTSVRAVIMFVLWTWHDVDLVNLKQDPTNQYEVDVKPETWYSGVYGTVNHFSTVS